MGDHEVREWRLSARSVIKLRPLQPNHPEDEPLPVGEVVVPQWLAVRRTERQSGVILRGVACRASETQSLTARQPALGEPDPVLLTPMKVVISAPPRLDDNGAAGFVEQLRACKDSPAPVDFDFSTLEFAQPYGALIVGESLRRFRAYRAVRQLETECRAIGVSEYPISQACSYLSHVGFFRHAGWAAGKEPGEALGGPTYLPITVLKPAQFTGNPKELELARAVKAKCYSLAAVAFPGEEARDLVGYCFTEIVRNVFEHAEISRCTVMAQRYPNGNVEIAVVDSGCGVRASLSKAYSGLSSESALRRAIEPGVSSARRFGPSGNDLNAGFGLYVISELGRQLGQFCIWSEGVELSVSSQNSCVERPHLGGTAIKLSVSTAEAEYFSNWFAGTVARGEANLPSDAICTKGPSKSKMQDLW